MKLTVDDIQRRVKTKLDAAADYLRMVPDWEKMWMLDPGFSQTELESVEKDGREQVKTSDPYDTVLLAQRLISSAPRIDIPPSKNEDECIKRAEKKERFLLAMWQRMNQLQGRNIPQDSAWSMLVRGRTAVEVKWIKEILPPGQGRFPISIRTLNPTEAHVHHGPLYPEYGFYRTQEKRVDLRQQYPRYKFEESRYNTVDDEEQKHWVVDFWWINHKTGKYWNAVVIDDDFAKKPTETDYTFLPIIVAYGEGAPVGNEAYRGLSVLHPLNGQWQAKCRNLSNMATAALWASWPFFTVENEQGREVDDITVRPGATANVPAGTRINQIMPNVNMGSLQAMMQQLQANIQKSTFPDLMYGDTGSLQSGYGVGIVTDSAAGRVKLQIEALELLIMMVNEAVMRLIVAFDDDDEGVTIWGRDERNRKMYSLTLTKKDIEEYYENLVKLRPNTPQDDMQRSMMGQQLVAAGVLSEETYRDEWLPIQSPTDEKQRVLAEQAQKAPGVAENMQLLALMKMFPQSWKDMIAGTPLEQQAEKIMQSRQKRKQQEGQPMHMMPDGTMMPGAEHVGPMPPVGPPLPIPPGMPPGPGGPPMGPQGAQLPPLMTGPQGGGVPPQLAGQITPEMIGMAGDQNPLLFQQLMQGPDNIPPAELLALLEQGRN